MDLKTRNQRQLEEANSSVNRWYFWEKFHREPIDFAELLEYYITSGGARDFARKEADEQKERKA